MSLSTAVHTEHDIAAFLIDKLYNIVINQHAICRESKVEVLVVLLLQLSAVSNKLLADIPVE